MNISFGFGKGLIQLDIPDKNLMKVLEPNPIETLGDETELIRHALDNPIGSPSLDRIVHPGEKIAIITSDITRPMPSDKVLPLLLADLEKIGIPDKDILIVFALGNHRPHTSEEQKKLVGEKVFARYQCIDSNGTVVHLGMTANGTPIDIFDRVAKADKRICLGNIEFHYFAGYSGGVKSIMPHFGHLIPCSAI